MERNLGNPLISPRGLAADHRISRLLLLLVDQDEDNEGNKEMVLHTMFVHVVDHNE